jgi:hypothetical protein
MMTKIGLPSINKLPPLENLEFKSDIYTLPKSKFHPAYSNHHYCSMSLEWTSSAARLIQWLLSHFKHLLVHLNQQLPHINFKGILHSTSSYLHLNLSMGGTNSLAGHRWCDSLMTAGLDVTRLDSFDLNGVAWP